MCTVKTGFTPNKKLCQKVHITEEKNKEYALDAVKSQQERENACVLNVLRLQRNTQTKVEIFLENKVYALDVAKINYLETRKIVLSALRNV